MVNLTSVPSAGLAALECRRRNDHADGYGNRLPPSNVHIVPSFVFQGKKSMSEARHVRFRERRGGATPRAYSCRSWGPKRSIFGPYGFPIAGGLLQQSAFSLHSIAIRWVSALKSVPLVDAE